MSILRRAARSTISLYRPLYAKKLVLLLLQYNCHAGRYLAAYWRTQDFSVASSERELIGEREREWANILLAGMLAQVAAGVLLVVLGATGKLTAGVVFGIALVISYPIVWAHLLALAALAVRVAYYIEHPKQLGREIVCNILESQVKALRYKHTFTLVAVAGSVGKTSTKLAIADLLAQSKRVRHQSGNYNDRVTVPLVLFGHDEPNILNVFAWFKIFVANARALSKPFPYDVVVVELGTDAPGQLEKFAYLQPEIGVVTAVAPEHMEFLKTLDAVAAEELSLFDFCKQVLVNIDDVAPEYLTDKTYDGYSVTKTHAAYYAKPTAKDFEGQQLALRIVDHTYDANIAYLGKQGAKFALAAAAVADKLDVKAATIVKGLGELHHFAGRMQILPGIQDSILIDDTYNASPVAVTAALDVLYGAKAPQRIALLGNMNELGKHSAAAHREIGDYCDPKKLDLVLTLGKDANKYTALAAKANGCTVVTFKSPYEAGEYIKLHMQPGAVVLAKGSQNGVFAEEALKVLLADPADASKLVRQSKYWLKRKKQQFYP